MSTPMGTLAKKIRQEATKHPRTLQHWFDALDADDQQAITEALVSGDISATRMHTILKSLEENPCPFGVTAFKDFARKVKENA